MKVAHFVRKRSQLDSSFIYNQILNHQKADPVIFYAFDDKKEGVENFPITRYPSYNLYWKAGILDKLSWLFSLKPTKLKSRQLIKLLKEENPDILHFHYGSDAGIFLPVLKNMNFPSLVSFYGYDCTGFPKYYLSLGKLFLKHRVFSNTSIVTAMSENMKNDIIQLGCNENKIIVHYHGIKTGLFQAKKSWNSGDIIKFLIISSFTPQKGHIFLLNAFQKALEKTEKIQLLIVGGGSEKTAIEKHIADRKINHVIVHNPVKYASSEHLSYLSDADVFVHPSITDLKGNKEGIPGSIVEAMSFGLPVISTYHAGIPEIINHLRTGFLVNENDTDALAKAIITLAEQPILRKTLGLAAREYATSKLDIGVKEKELEELYCNTINNYLT